ncbi:MAG: hypothetical protein R3B09_35355, partial [Nannocystaceae bacterium]
PKVRSIAEFKAQATPLRCERAIRCGSIAASSRERCLDDESALQEQLLGVTRGLAAGRYAFDPAAAGECLRLLADAPCNVDPLPELGACLAGAVPGYLRAAVPPGGACERWEECVDGLCDGELGCPGQCKARTREVGGHCDNNTLCDDRLFCDDGECKARADVGGTCSNHWQACKAGLRCVGASSSDEWGHREGTCERPKGRDQACERDGVGDDCRSDLYCDFGAETPRCRERLPGGATCRWLDACADGFTCAGLVLAAHGSPGTGMRAIAEAGTCAPHLDVGSACDPDAELRPCPHDLRCDKASRRCVARGRDGERCATTEECGSYHTCDRASRTCIPQVGPGERCRPGGEEFHGHCFLGTCDPKTRRCVPSCARKGR